MHASIRFKSSCDFRVSRGARASRTVSRPCYGIHGRALPVGWHQKGCRGCVWGPGTRQLWARAQARDDGEPAAPRTTPKWKRLLPPAAARAVSRVVGCEDCAGTRRVGCPNCDGLGRYEAMGGRLVACNACKGTGRVVCRSCFIGNGWDIDAIRKDMGYPD